MRAYWRQLGWRGRATWAAHLFKACAQQHHREMAPLFRALLPPDGVVVDAGAHSGQFAKLFARLVPDGRVYAFEPSGYARSILVPALRVNRLRGVRVQAYGLSDAGADLMLRTPIKRSGSAGFGIASLGETATGRPEIEERVALRRLDDVAEELALDRLDLLKADIEGWELRMLTGARDTLARFRPALLVELTPHALARAGDDLDGVVRLLAPLGYRPYLSESVGTWHPGLPTGPADVLWLTERHAACLDAEGAPRAGGGGQPLRDGKGGSTAR